jgi:putative MATE family efflux protein
LESAVSYKRIWEVAYPIILGSVAQNLINVTDTAFLGRVGEIELGASALGGMYYFVLIMLAMGFGTGAQIIIARRLGENKHDDIGATFNHAFYFMVPLALVSFLLMFFLSSSILRPVVESDAIFTSTIQYVDYRMYGIFFAFGQVLFRSFYIGIAYTKVITWSTIVMAGVNVVLDYALIFGHWGFPEMGIQGAALASVIAEFSALAFLLVYTINKKFKKQYKLFEPQKPDLKLFNRLLKLSSPIMLQNFLSLGVWFAFFLFVEKLGEQALAISNIIRSIYIVLMIPVWGFAAAANSLASYLIGMGKSDEIFKLLKRIILMCVSGVAAFVLLSLIVPEAIISVYTNDPSLLEGSVPVLFVVNFGALAIAVGFILFNGVLGTGKTHISFLIELVVLTVYLLFVYIAVNRFQANVTQVWISEIVYGLLLALLSWLYLKKGRWSSAGI